MTQNQNHDLIIVSKHAAKLVQQYLAAEEVSPEGKAKVYQSLDVIREALDRFKYVLFLPRHNPFITIVMI
jgi:hypothetical protein